MADPNVPNRQQLINFAGGDPELMRGLERLFQVAGSETPAEVNTILTLIAALEQSPAAGQINALAGALAELAAAMGVAPPERPQEAPDDLSPRRVPTLDGLADVDAPAPAMGDLLQFDGAQWVPVTGASGTFTTSDPFTVTVASGIITSIV